jgi:hypothetical protein
MEKEEESKNREQKPDWLFQGYFPYKGYNRADFLILPDKADLFGDFAIVSHSPDPWKLR